MGSSTNETDRNAAFEGPQSAVTIIRGFGGQVRGNASGMSSWVQICGELLYSRQPFDLTRRFILAIAAMILDSFGGSEGWLTNQVN